jgi:alanine racemase
VEVDLSAIRRNAERLAARLPGCRLLPMVKADGYGLGAERVARAVSPIGVWGLGVATAEEGGRLRSAGHGGRIVVFSPLPSLDAPRILEADLEPAITSLEALETFGRTAEEHGVRIGVHLEVDTGMGRFGLGAAAAASWAVDVGRLLNEYPVELASTFTHFHSADSNERSTLAQWSAFEGALARLREEGIHPGLIHAANSAAALRYKECAADIVRPGIALFGGSRPFSDAVVSVRARVLDVRDVEEGGTVSYGATYRTKAAARLATLAIGYADGVRLELSNRGAVLIRGQRAPIRGAVCMDVTVVDVTQVGGVQSGEVATLLGRDGQEEITLQEISTLCETIDYEILTGLSPRLPRISVEAG